MTKDEDGQVHYLLVIILGILALVVPSIPFQIFLCVVIWTILGYRYYKIKEYNEQL